MDLVAVCRGHLKPVLAAAPEGQKAAIADHIDRVCSDAVRVCPFEIGSSHEKLFEAEDRFHASVAALRAAAVAVLDGPLAARADTALTEIEEMGRTQLARVADEGYMYGSGGCGSFLVAACRHHEAASVVERLIAMGASPAGALDAVVLNNNHDATDALLGSRHAEELRKDGAPLIGAGCGDCSIEMLERLIAHGVTVNAVGRFGLTPLSSAARWGNVDVVRTLLAAGATLNGRPLFEAIDHATFDSEASSHREVVRLLIGAGADPNERYCDDSTPLTAACSIERKDLGVAIATDLLDRGAAVDGGYPLHAACGHGSVDAARMLLERGAEPQLLNEECETPWGAFELSPSMYTDQAMADLLIRYGAVQGCVAQGPPWTPKGHAAFPAGFRSSVRALFGVAARLGPRPAAPCGLPHLPHELWHCIALFCGRGWFPPGSSLVPAKHMYV